MPRRFVESSQKRFELSCDNNPPAPANKTEPEVIADAKKLVVLAVPEIVRAVDEA